MAKEPVMREDVRNLLREGYQARKDGQPETARQKFQAVVNLCDPGQLLPETACALAGLAQIERDLSHNDAALAHYERALHIHRGNGDPLRVAHVVRHIADIHRHEGHTEQALSGYVEALELYRSHPDTPPLDLANALRGLAILRQQTGSLDESAALWTQARELYTAAGVQLP
jgi:tetratricopeptide (TPR) repeat protein